MSGSMDRPPEARLRFSLTLHLLNEYKQPSLIKKAEIGLYAEKLLKGNPTIEHRVAKHKCTEMSL